MYVYVVYVYGYMLLIGRDGGLSTLCHAIVAGLIIGRGC